MINHATPADILSLVSDILFENDRHVLEAS